MKVLSAVFFAAGLAIAADTARIDAIFAPLADAKSPGIAVMVRKNGETIVQRGYGVRDLRTLTPIDAKTNFRLASCTKQFTAMAIMLLVNDGRLRYSEPLTEIFPDFPEYGRAITVRHLLTHTGGLPDYEDLMEAGPWTESRQIQDDEVFALLKKQSKPKFAAGTKWEYSNSGYVMLGLIVAKASGMPFDEFLRRRIFAPLHMDSTLAYRKGKNEVGNRAYGHSKRDVETDQSSTSATLGDGGVYSNLDDLAKWNDALDKYTLLPEARMKAAWTPASLADGSETTYGFGWFLEPYNGRVRVRHDGSTRGFSTAIERFPNEKLTIVVLCNRTDLIAPKLAQQVADLMR
jgi:CubicO group peptidase (beta-lactamase class C family)